MAQNPKEREYDAFVAKARQLTAAGEAKYVEKMLFLNTIFDTPQIWIWRHTSWDDVLDHYKFSTANLFYNFRNGCKVVPAADVYRFGVMATARVGQLPVKLRSRVVPAMRDWYAKYRTPPEYQLVTAFVRTLSPKKERRKPDLHAYIRKLQQILRSNGITPPPMPA